MDQAKPPSSPNLVLSPSEFTQAFIRRLEVVAPDVKAEVAGDLEILLTSPDGRDISGFLDNAYTEYQQRPEHLDDVLDRFVGSTIETVLQDFDEELPPDRIVPVIKDAAYPVQIKASLIESGFDADKLDYYYEPLNDELLVFYVVDTARNMRFLSQQDVESLELPPGRLRRRSLENLRAILPDIQRHGDENLYMLTAGGTYEASLLLLDSIWTEETFPVDGEIVAAVPSRDLLLVTGSRCEAGVRRMRQAVRKTLAEGSYTLTDRLFIRRDAAWAVWK